MTRSILTAKSALNQALAQAKIARAIIKAHCEAARLLMDENDMHDLETVSRETATAIATVESYLSDFKRQGFYSKKFACK